MAYLEIEQLSSEDEQFHVIRHLPNQYSYEGTEVLGEHYGILGSVPLCCETDSKR